MLLFDSVNGLGWNFFRIFSYFQGKYPQNRFNLLNVKLSQDY